MLVSVLGVIAIILQWIRMWPQAVHILRRRDATGVSEITWHISLVVSVVWFTYGFAYHAPVFIVNNVMTAAVTVCILYGVARYGSGSRWLPLVTIVASTVSSLLLLDLGGTKVFSAVAIGAGMVMFLPQAVKVFRSSVSGVSPLAWRLTALSSAAWLAYALVRDLPAVLITHAVVLPCTLVILGRLAVLGRSSKRAT